MELCSVNGEDLCMSCGDGTQSSCVVFKYFTDWANSTLAWKSESFRSLYGYAPLILTESTKSENQLVHNNSKFKYPSINTWKVSSFTVFKLLIVNSQ